MNEKMIMQIIYNTYLTTMNEFIKLIKQSDIMKEQCYPIDSLFIGMNAVHRVFEYVLLKTKNAERAFFYSQKTYRYYLEYMEQIYKSNLSSNLNHLDAIVFVYKKTIIELHDSEPDQVLDNLMTITPNVLLLNEIDWRLRLTKMNSIINILFYGSNHTFTIENRVYLLNTYLMTFFDNMDNIEDLLCFLEWIQKKTDITFSNYDSLLGEFIARIGQKKHAKRISAITDEHLLQKFYIEKDTFFGFFEKCGGDGDSGSSMKELVTWLYEITPTKSSRLNL
jgi:hypothetical protein